MDEMLKRIKERIAQEDFFCRMLGITVEDAGPGVSRVQMPFHKDHLNSIGGLHGGAIMSLADMAFGVAANYGQDKVMITSSLTVSFMKAAKSGPITAEGRYINGGRKVGTYEVKIFDGEGAVIGVCIVCGYRLEISPDD